MSNANSKPTVEQVRQKFSYNPETGEIFHATSLFKKRIGTVAGNVSPTGYRLVKIKSKSFPAHRIAWVLHYGEWPLDDIDHINGIRSDNRIQNLRLCTQSLNNQNLKKARADNQCGYLGVGVEHIHLKRKNIVIKRYRARIMMYGKSKSLGNFDCPKLAHLAYLEAKRELHEFNTL